MEVFTEKQEHQGGIPNSAEGVIVKEFITELITLELHQEGQIEVIQDFIPSF